MKFICICWILFVTLSAVSADLIIAVPQPLTGQYEGDAKHITQAVTLWATTLNQKGGLTIGATQHNISLQIIDVGGSSQDEMVTKTRATATDIINGVYGSVTAIFAPFSAVLANETAQIVGNTIVTFITGDDSQTLFECDTSKSPCSAAGNGNRRFDLLTGLLAPPSTYFQPAITLMKIKGARSIALFYEDNASFKNMVDGASTSAADNNIEVVSTYKLDSLESIDDIIAELAAVGADVVIGATSPDGCIDFIKKAKANDYFPKALILSNCVTDKYTEDLGEDGRYVMSVVPWDSRLRGREHVEDGSVNAQHFIRTDNETSPELFFNTYTNTFGVNPTYISAASYAAGMSFQTAIVIARSEDPTLVARGIATINMRSFYGLLQFSPLGQLTTTTVATVQYDQNMATSLVSPLSSAEIDAIYPAPTWSERIANPSWYKTPAEIAIVTIAGCGVAFCLFLMILFYVWREKPQIVAASLIFVELIMLGALMMFASIFLWTLETTTGACVARYWLFNLGFGMMFANLLAKTWRIWRIFTYKKLKALKIPNIQLLKVVAILVSVEIIVLVIWSAAFTPVVEYIQPDPLRPALDYTQCSREGETPFVIILIVYNGGLIIAGVILGIWARKVVSEYNESKYVLISMYLLTFAGLILLIVYSINITDRVVDTIIRSAAILFGVFSTVTILFMPKVHFVLTRQKDPKALNSNLNKMGQTSTYMSAMSNGSTLEETAMMDQLKKRYVDLEEENKDLKAKLLQKEKLVMHTSTDLLLDKSGLSSPTSATSPHTAVAASPSSSGLYASPSDLPSSDESSSSSESD
jgi:ABC-type branched-subunit amino acid transport system substrate-binding protein